MSVHIWLFLVSVWRRDLMTDSSLSNSLLGRGNYHMNLSLGPGINPSNYEDTEHYSPGGVGGCGCN